MKKEKCNTKTVQKDTLIIIGNGFDIWQGLKTSYKHFFEYFSANQDTILKRLGMSKKWCVTYEDEDRISLSDADIIYGTPLDPSELDEEFWCDFENELGTPDAYTINMLFGKEEDALEDLETSTKNAEKIIREAFQSWISTIKIGERDTKYRFGSNCLFINFNYTDTLEKRFQIPNNDIFHIHGKISDPDTIVFGHSRHPQSPPELLSQLGGRFKGLYFIERMLEMTDKNVYLNFLNLLVFLALHGVKMSDIRNIYVLGHSLGETDEEYFEEIAAATGVPREDNIQSIRKEYKKINPDDKEYLRLHHAILAYGNDESIHYIDEGEVNRFAKMECVLEKEAIRKYCFKKFKRALRFFKKSSGEIHNLKKVLDNPLGTNVAQWHISYHSERDKRHIENTMNKLGVKDYKLYSSIDECIASFRH